MTQARPATALSTSRQVIAVVVAGLAGALGALILGEYDFSGFTPFIAGILFGLVIAEVMLTVAGRGRPVLAVGGAVISGLGVLWAGWISSGRGVAPIKGGVYVAIVLAMAVCALWIAGPTGLGQRKRRSSSGPGTAT